MWLRWLGRIAPGSRGSGCSEKADRFLAPSRQRRRRDAAVEVAAAAAVAELAVLLQQMTPLRAQAEEVAAALRPKTATLEVVGAVEAVAVRARSRCR